MKKNIEIEYRVEIPIGQFDETLSLLKKTYNLHSHTQRLSFMSFFKQDNKQFDVRVRITNGNSELVLKVGELHSDDRVEMSQEIDKNQLVGLSRMFSHITDANYIAERETFNFESHDGTIIISLVRGENTAYIEYELQDDSLTEEAAKQKLLDIIHSHGLVELDENGFTALNHKLDKEDWQFHDRPEDIDHLREILSARYIS